MFDWIQYYLKCQFPIIPLGSGSKCPVARGWHENRYPAQAFTHKNVGTRAGEWVCVDGKEGYLLIVDFDSPDLELLKELCALASLSRTTCVRTGGNHHGYHLIYLTEWETRKHGMLSYREASIDLLGKGSFAVLPPSIVESPYTYLLGLDELTFMSRETYDALISTLQSWKQVNALIKKVANQKLSAEQALASLTDQNPAPEKLAYFRDALDRMPAQD